VSGGSLASPVGVEPLPPARPPARALGGARGFARRVRDGLARIPRAGRVCLLIAFVNAAIWGAVVPPFQVPDEIAHFAYAQYLAETGKAPPQGARAQYSPEEQSTLEALNFFSVIGRPQMRGILSPAEDATLRAALAAHPSPRGEGGSTSVSNQPPLYYALETIPYWASPSHNILTRLALMRLLSALLAAGTVLAIYLFLRELMPSSPWAWCVGALAVAFQPTFAFIAAGVQGDNLLFLASALTFLMLARAYRRGLTTRRAVAIGVVAAIGTLGKLTYIALLPGVALALALLCWRLLPEGRSRALRTFGVALITAAAPIALYLLLNVTVWHRGSPAAGGIAAATNGNLPGGGAVTLRETLDYTWELYLPRLWFMHHAYFAHWPVWELWFNGLVGHFGWLDYTFPNWVYDVGRYVFYALAALAIVGVARSRAALRRLLPLGVCFAVMALGLLGAIGYAGIRYKLSSGYTFEQARYLFPLLALYATFIVLVARGLPGRLAVVLGGLLVVLAMAHGLFAETLTISRYYG
jgi:4-amino-4-deoxy-L-arabinose transferase-like glycosyltransferase